jgi:hypothetical protein
MLLSIFHHVQQITFTQFLLAKEYEAQTGMSVLPFFVFVGQAFTMGRGPVCSI